MLSLILLLLILLANATPVLLRYLCRSRWNAPVDGGQRFVDGRRWLGESKTWRGLVGALVATAAAGPLLGLGAGIALLIAAAAMAGDLLSSFIKRRLGKPASAQLPLLDQIPESLLPMLVAHWLLGVGWPAVIGVCAAFTLINMGISPVLHRWGLRRKPH